MKHVLVTLFVLSYFIVSGQYSKEKLSDILTNKSEKTWSVKGVNAERLEKAVTFNVNNSGIVETNDGKKENVKWSLSTTDNIRWFLSLGTITYEMIISYDKKGEQYVKLTHKADGKSALYFEIKLVELKK